MSASLVKSIVAELASDPAALAELAAALAPYAPAAVPMEEDRWMDTRAAAAYLGYTSVNPLNKLTASRAVPFRQDARGGKCWFKRSELDEWRARRT